MKNAMYCGVCGRIMKRIQIPANEPHVYWSYLDERGAIVIIGAASAVSSKTLKKYHDLKIELTEVVPSQWGCPKCETIATNWMRKDGKPGFAFMMNKARKELVKLGKAHPIVSELPGKLGKIV